MSERNRRENVETVLDAFVSSGPEPGTVALQRWIVRYPYYERELTDFAAAWILMDTLPPDPDTEEKDEQALIERGQAIIDAVFSGDEVPSSVGEERPLAGLMDEASNLGITMHEFASVTGLSPALVAKLDQRLIRAVTVPDEVLRRLAAPIRRSAEEIMSHLHREPVVPAAMEYKADKAPTVPDQQDFFDAVRGDRGLGDEQRRRLLSLARSDIG